MLKNAKVDSSFPFFVLFDVVEVAGCDLDSLTSLCYINTTLNEDRISRFHFISNIFSFIGSI
jgi:hypothetical protein